MPSISSFLYAHFLSWIFLEQKKEQKETKIWVFFWTILLFLEMADSILIIFGVWNVTKIINLNLISANLR